MKKVRNGKQLLAMALSAALTISGLPAVVLAEGQTTKMTGEGYKCTQEHAADSGYPCEICKVSDDILLQEPDGEVVYLQEAKGVKNITGWTFPDDGNLSGREHALPDVNVENQTDYKTVVSMLPTAISAEIEGEDGTTQVDIAGWDCPEYVKDDSGNWPVVGEYTFTAELQEGYVCDTVPVVKVVIGGAAIYEYSRSYSFDEVNGNPSTQQISDNGYFFDQNEGKLTITSDAGTTEWKKNAEITNVKNLEITDGVTVIGPSAFQKCTWLTSVTIPKSVTNIRTNAFNECKNLTSVTFADDLKAQIGPSAFQNCESLTSVTIPEGVTRIDANAFQNCKNLTSVTLGDGLKYIGNRAFNSCSLTSITIPEGVTNIGEQAFYNCTKLTSVTIPKSVIDIGNFAFLNCDELKKVILKCNPAPKISNQVFPSKERNPDLVIYIPNGASGYDEADWLKNQIKEGPALLLKAEPKSPTTFPGKVTLTATLCEKASGESGIGERNIQFTKSISESHTVATDNSGEATYTFSNLLPGTYNFVASFDGDNEYGPATAKVVYTVEASVVDILDISGVEAPVRGEEPVTSITGTAQYTGSVSWSPTVQSGGQFEADTTYTATIILSPKDGFTLEGVKKDAFKVEGAKPVNNEADSGVITAVFPKTDPIPHSHSYGDWKSDGTDHWRQCSCGSISDKASHDFGKWSVDQKPDEDGTVSSSRECTLCGYKQTEKNVPQTLTDSETGVTVKGDFTSGAAISVKEAVLHEEGTCKVCDEIRARQKAGELIVLYDISLTSGINSGEMEISIPVDEKYNGQTVILLHCMDKEEERLEVKVENGLVKFTTKSLSPFAVLDTKRAESIKLTPSSLTLEVGKSRQLTYTVTPEDIHSDEVIWTTSNKKVATVSPSGKVQAVKAGTATITCTAADGGGAKATCKVTVKNTATPLIILKGTAGKNSVRLNWNQISNADGYEIYGSRCGSNSAYKKIKTIKKGTTKTWTQSGLKSATAYKYYVKAYKLVNGKKLYLRVSKTSHVSTTGGKYTNAKTVTATFTDITLAKGKTRQISARITPVKKGGKLASHVPEFRYKTTNSKVAAVTDSGKIKAAGKGKCSIYVYANNGVTRRIRITVK